MVTLDFISRGSHHHTGGFSVMACIMFNLLAIKIKIDSSFVPKNFRAVQGIQGS